MPPMPSTPMPPIPSPANIQSLRLTLLPYTLDLITMTMRDKAEVARALAVHVPEEWPGADYEEILPLVAMNLETDPARCAWDRIIVHRGDATAIGGIGCKAPPDAEGRVEIGYSIVSSYRGHGYASEAAGALVAWLFAQPAVRRIAAECFEDNAASARVLEKLGMRRMGRADTPEGPLLSWELRKDERAAP